MYLGGNRASLGARFAWKRRLKLIQPYQTGIQRYILGRITLPLTVENRI